MTVSRALDYLERYYISERQERRCKIRDELLYAVRRPHTSRKLVQHMENVFDCDMENVCNGVVSYFSTQELDDSGCYCYDRDEIIDYIVEEAEHSDRRTINICNHIHQTSCYVLDLLVFVIVWFIILYIISIVKG